MPPTELERRTQLATDIAVIKEKVDSMHNYLLGNGNPGVIATLKSRVWRVEVVLLIVGGILVGLGLLRLNVLQALAL